MRLSKRDLVATGLVAAAAIVWVLSALDLALPGVSSVRATGFVVLALGFVASAAAVVPTFLELLHGNRTYLVVTSLLGLVALAAGVMTMVMESWTALGAVVGVTVLLWVIATVHHTMLNDIRAVETDRPISRLHHPTGALH